MTTVPRSNSKKLLDAIHDARSKDRTPGDIERLQRYVLIVRPGHVEELWDRDVLTVCETEILMRWRVQAGLQP